MRACFLLLLALGAAGSAQQPDALPVDSPLDREIRAGETHVYKVALPPGHFGHVRVTQGDTDVRVRLRRTGLGTIAVDRLPYGGVEDLPWIAGNECGECQVEVAAVGETQPGHYQLQFATRPPTAADQKRVTAFQQAWVEARVLGDGGLAAKAAEALAKNEAAGALFGELGDNAWQVYTILGRTQVMHRQGRYADARKLLEEALPISLPTGEMYVLSTIWNGIATMASSQGDLRTALAMYQKALELRRQRPGDRANLATVLSNIGGVYKNLGERARALETLQEALALQRQVGNPDRIARFLSNLAGLHMVSGEYQKALEASIEAYNLYTDKSTPGERAGAALLLGNIYFSVGQRQRAVPYWQRAALLYREAGQKSGLASAQYSIGKEAAQRGAYAEAVKAFEEGLREAEQRTVRTNLLTANCEAHLRLGNLDPARNAALEAQRIGEASGHRIGVAMAHSCLGQLEMQSGNAEKSRQHLEEALRGVQAATSPEEERTVRLQLAALERQQGRKQEALAHLEIAARLEEASRAKLADADSRASYRGTRADLLDQQTELLMAMHQDQPAGGFDRKAFTLTERWRARSLTELIAASNLRQDLTVEQREREDKLLGAIRSVQRELFQDGVSAAKRQELQRQLADREAEFERMQVSLRQGGSRYAAVTYAETLSDSGIQERLLDAGTVLVAYSLGKQASYAWAVTKSGVTAAVLPRREVIEGQVEAYRKLLAERVTTLTAARSLARIDQLGAALYKSLLAPFNATLRGKTSLILVPDGALAYLPFETLAGGPAPLLETLRVRYAPAASTLAALRQRGQQRVPPSVALLAFADPERGAGKASPVMEAYRERGFSFTSLPNARREVSELQSLFGAKASEVFTGAEARETVLAGKDLSEFRYLHFAAHGYFDAEFPERSGIVLATPQGSENDGVLQASEVVRLKLNADLVTLSACQTGLGRLLAGEGVMGLSRAFLHAGAQSVVVSLWNVNDAATAELMKHFYGNLKAGMARDEALRQAKLTLRRTPASPWRHPYFWAPFVLIGER